jgi:hypothetical protein
MSGSVARTPPAPARSTRTSQGPVGLLLEKWPAATRTADGRVTMKVSSMPRAESRRARSNVSRSLPLLLARAYDSTISAKFEYPGSEPGARFNRILARASRRSASVRPA